MPSRQSGGRSGWLGVALAGVLEWAACGPQTLEPDASAGASTGASLAATGLSNGGGSRGPAAAASGGTSGAGTSGTGTGETTAGAGAGAGVAATVAAATAGTASSGTSGATSGSAATSGGTTGSTTGSTTGGTSGGPGAAGIWIFRFDDLGYASWDAVALDVAGQGAGYVLIKGSDGDVPETMTVNGQATPQLTAATVQAFTTLGIRVYAWSYVYPDDSSAGALAVIASYAALPGVSGLVLDAEIEFEDDATADADATALCSGIRQALPASSFLGYSSFAIASDHAGFPYAAFDAACGDGFFPQVYWSLFSPPLDSWQAALAQCVSDVQGLGLLAPLWPIGCNYAADASGDVTGTVPTADLNAFLVDAGPTASLWEYPQSSWPGYSTFLSQLAALDW